MDGEGDKCPKTIVKLEVRRVTVNHTWVVSAGSRDLQLQESDTRRSTLKCLFLSIKHTIGCNAVTQTLKTRER